MGTYFVPYAGNNPAAVNIKGHKLLIVASDSDDILEDLPAIGADEVRELVLSGSEDETSEILANLAADVGGGVVLTPPGITPSVMISSLEQELPWIH